MSTETGRRSEHGGAVFPEVLEPKLYAVVLHNDNYTTMDFVITVLMKVFRKSGEEAAAIMMEVHNNGEGTAGVYPFDIAVTKKLLAERMAETENFPLKISVQEVKQ